MMIWCHVCEYQPGVEFLWQPIEVLVTIVVDGSVGFDRSNVEGLLTIVVFKTIKRLLTIVVLLLL